MSNRDWGRRDDWRGHDRDSDWRDRRSNDRDHRC
jgi:hypothetical protein